MYVNPVMYQRCGGLSSRRLRREVAVTVDLCCADVVRDDNVHSLAPCRVRPGISIPLLPVSRNNKLTGAGTLFECCIC